MIFCRKRITSADGGSDVITSNLAKVQPGESERIGPGAISFLVPIAITVAVGILGIQSILQALLVQRASSTGMDWAHHIAARVPHMSGAHGPSGKRHQAPASKEFTDMVNGIFSIGNIYQIDVINPDCFCGTSLRAFATNHAGINKRERGAPERHIAKAEPHSFVQHVLETRVKHSPQGVDANLKNRWPVDRARLRSIVAKGDVAKVDRHIFIHENVGPNQPRTFGEVLHPVSANGKVIYVLRVLVNLERDKAQYLAALHRGAGLVALLLLCISGMPLIWYFNASKRQEIANSRVRFLAVHDMLTGIANRNAFQDQAPKILKDCAERGQAAALILLDLNKFKEINDHCGHPAGDQLLQELARELKANLPEEAYIARIGGDEFVVMLGGLDPAAVGDLDLSSLPKEVSFECEQSGQTIAATVSSGVACYPRDGKTVDKLMQSADFALYDAKSIVDGGTRLFDQRMRADFDASVVLREEFKCALEKSEIEPFYQPLVSLETGQVEGFEALARWRHPGKGILTPEIFEALLSDHEIGRMVGRLMFEKIINDMKAWKSAGVQFESVGMNVGEGDLIQPNFALNILSTLTKNGLVPSDFAVEVTETCMFGRNKRAFIKQLEHLRTAGCYIALDDFGTGYSSITQIKELPCTAVKIDKSFVLDVESNEADRAIIEALLKLGDTVGFKVILEGVETAEQRDLLRSMGCSMAQGFFYARPVPAADVPLLLEQLNGERPDGDMTRACRVLLEA